jgi:hypothetical protein
MGCKTKQQNSQPMIGSFSLMSRIRLITINGNASDALAFLS